MGQHRLPQSVVKLQGKRHLFDPEALHGMPLQPLREQDHLLHMKRTFKRWHLLLSQNQLRPSLIHLHTINTHLHQAKRAHLPTWRRGRSTMMVTTTVDMRRKKATKEEWSVLAANKTKRLCWRRQISFVCVKTMGLMPASLVNGPSPTSPTAKGTSDLSTWEKTRMLPVLIVKSKCCGLTSKGVCLFSCLQKGVLVSNT